MNDAWNTLPFMRQGSVEPARSMTASCGPLSFSPEALYLYSHTAEGDEEEEEEEEARWRAPAFFSSLCPDIYYFPEKQLPPSFFLSPSPNSRV